MEQIYNSVIQLTQHIAQQSQTAPVKRDTDSFRKLMEQRQAARPEETPRKPAAEETSREEAPQTAVADESQVQEQMVLAAMAVMQNPVVVPQGPEMMAEVSETAVQTVQNLDIPVQQAAEQAVVPVERQTAQPMAPEQNAAFQTEIPETGMETPEELLGKAETATVKAPAETAAQQETEAVSNAQSRPETAEQRETGPDVKSGQKQSQQPLEAEAPVFREVRAVPVKVGEAPAAEQTAKPMEAQISEKLTQAIEIGENRVEIQLEPENLGRVSVELTWNSDGTLRVALHAENSQTRSLLERDVTGLQSLLMRNTQQEVQVEVQRQQESQQQNLYDERQNDNRQNPQQQRRDDRRNSAQDFLQQLRLGLIPLDGEAS